MKGVAGNPRLFLFIWPNSMLAAFSALSNRSLHAELLIALCIDGGMNHVVLFWYILLSDSYPCYQVKRKGPDDIYLIDFMMITSLSICTWKRQLNQAHQSFFVLMLYATTWWMSASKKTGIPNAWFACMYSISLYFWTVFLDWFRRR